MSKPTAVPTPAVAPSATTSASTSQPASGATTPINYAAAAKARGPAPVATQAPAPSAAAVTSPRLANGRDGGYGGADVTLPNRPLNMPSASA